MQKKITIVIPTRNDNFYDNFASIINFTLNYSLSKIYQLKLQNIFQILLIDWSSVTRLNKEIYIPKKFRKIVKIIFVNKNSIKTSPKNRFNVSEAQNFGLSLTKTKYCFLAHADQIYPKSFFLNLKHFVNNQYLSQKKTENSILYIPRKFIDENFFSHFVSESTIDEYFENLSFINQKWKNDQYFIGGGQSGWFGTKETLQKFGGLKENLILKNKNEIISADLEFYQRYSQHFKFYDSSNFGIFAYRYPYVFSKKRNQKLLKRIPPIIVDKPIKRNIKKIKFKIEKLNDKTVDNKSKLPKFIEKKNILKIREYFNFSKNEIIDRINENQKENFIIRDLLIDLIYSNKIIAYLEYGYSGSSIISIIGNIFKGIDILGADFSYKYENQKIHNRLFKLASHFHTSKKLNRFGKTKLLSFDKVEQSKFIFSYLPKEKFKTIILVNPFKINLDLFKDCIYKNKNYVFCLLINSSDQKFKFLNKSFHKINLYKYTYVYLNKSLLKNKKDELINAINKNKKDLNLKYFIYGIFKFLNN